MYRITPLAAPYVDRLAGLVADVLDVHGDVPAPDSHTHPNHPSRAEAAAAGHPSCTICLSYLQPALCHTPLTQRRMRRPWRWRPLHSARPPRIHHICPNSDSCHSSLGSRLSNTYQGGGYTSTQPTFKQYAVPRILEAKSDDKTRYICSSQDTHPNSKPRTAQLWQ